MLHRSAVHVMEDASLRQHGNRHVFLGHLYATCFTMQILSKWQKLERGLMIFLSNPVNLAIHYQGAPPPEAKEDSDAVISYCLRRQWDHTKGSIGHYDLDLENATCDQELSDGQLALQLVL